MRLGEYDANSSEDCDRSDPDEVECADPVIDIPVQSFKFHPDFLNNRVKLTDDIGIVKLSKAANFKHNNIKPICLPFGEENSQIPNKLVAIGWGFTEPSKRKHAAILQKAVLPLYNTKGCFEKLSPKNKQLIIADGQFCAGGEGDDKNDSRSVTKMIQMIFAGRVDTCSGDSGSALQSAGFINERPKMVQYGIVSYGASSCGVEERLPAVYTKVSKYLNWILDNMQ